MADLLTKAVAVAVTAPQRAIVSVARPVSRQVTVRTQGPQGAPGRAGRDGDGVETAFGQITITDRNVGLEDSFAPNVRQQLRFNPSTMTTQDKLLAPFAGHTFFADNVLIARATDDVYTICINLLVMSDQAGGKLKMDIDTGSTLGPLQADDKSLFAAAGVIERITFRFDITVLTTFLANGARFFLTSTRPVTVASETLFLVPLTIQPAAS